MWYSATVLKTRRVNVLLPTKPTLPNPILSLSPGTSFTAMERSPVPRTIFPVYNADDASPTVGPLLRSTCSRCSGNHDILERNLGRYPDGLAYFLYWAQPLNGPLEGQVAEHSDTERARENWIPFLEAAGKNYPRMANFSFDYANAHWIVLDSNPYVDWTEPSLRASGFLTT